jgi:adenylate cyclase
MLLFVFYRFWNGKTLSDWPAADLIGSTSTAIWIMCLGGFLVGVISELLELFFFRKLFQRIHTPVTILVKSIAQFLVLLAYGFTIIFSLDYYERMSYSSTVAYMWGYVDTADALPLMVFVFGIIFFVSVFRRLYRLVGPLNFVNVMVGKYNRPREEDRIFMFLDLNSSTELAETLGNKRVSRLIQECFNDLASISLEYRAQTYQYVGDEVVLTWLSDSGYKDDRCLEIYFAFQQLLQSRSKFYMSRFGIVPEFKCALHGGLVVSTQVGQLKVEIAFHGDVVNTTARMLEKCHHFNESFIVSETVYNKLGKNKNFNFKNLGTADLRGKSEQLDLFAVKPVKSFYTQPSSLETAGVIF